MDNQPKEPQQPPKPPEPAKPDQPRSPISTGIPSPFRPPESTPAPTPTETSSPFVTPTPEVSHEPASTVTPPFGAPTFEPGGLNVGPDYGAEPIRVQRNPNDNPILAGEQPLTQKGAATDEGFVPHFPATETPSDQPVVPPAQPAEQPTGEYHLGDTVVLDKTKQDEIANIRAQVDAERQATQTSSQTPPFSGAKFGNDLGQFSPPVSTEQPQAQPAAQPEQPAPQTGNWFTRLFRKGK